MEVPVNYLSVLACGLASMVIGSLWYGPVFGKMWKGLMGFTDESMKNMKIKPAYAMCAGLVTALVMAYVLGHFAMLTNATGLDGA